ncbi:Interferon-induced protein [Merluccius polli]|uniref:Interferon-induced protein n=1 Tax=Merluccius polli TaxID=89951 RepID=A0AA47MYZ3_MERPO|nr:Interferon-induced protein [Merluccius polli]
MMDEDSGLMTLEDIQEETTKLKYDKLFEEQQKLRKTASVRERLAQTFRDKALVATRGLEQAQLKLDQDMESKQEKLLSLQEEDRQLTEQLKETDEDIRQQDAKIDELKNAANAISVVPEREVVFRGSTRDVANPNAFDVKSHIKYPMDGGTALITFDEELVAENILSMPTHKVKLEEECFIVVEVHPVRLTVPTYVEMDTRVCPRSILVSNLPSLESEFMLDKLELHFSKKVNGGGEVASRHFQRDVGNAVLVFVDDNIALGLTEKEAHKVTFERNKSPKVRVTPFVNGTITRLETKSQDCARSVLLTGIPAVMDPATLQDMLEIYFQKSTNGGGEISNIVYNPQGQATVALFKDDVVKGAGLA